MTDRKEVQNILIVALNDNFTRRVTSLLAESLEMFCLDCHDMIVYDLINPKEVLEKCGLEYFKKREQSVIKNCANFLNTCISINFDLISQYSEMFQKSLVIYLSLPYEKITKVPDKIDFEHRDKMLRKISDNVVNLEKKSINSAVEQIIKKIGERYENS